MGAFILEKAGKKYGHWRVHSFHQMDSHGDARWWCKCELCGNLYSVRGFSLRNGRSTRCIHCKHKGRDK